MNVQPIFVVSLLLLTRPFFQGGVFFDCLLLLFFRYSFLDSPIDSQKVLNPHLGDPHLILLPVHVRKQSSKSRLKKSPAPYIGICSHLMSRYFAAAENCGLRTSGEEALRLSRRTVASTTSGEVAAQAAERAKADAERVARYKRQPDAVLEVVPVEELPLASGRTRHEAALQQSRDDLLTREQRDLDDFSQRRKVQEMQETELRALLRQEEETRQQELRSQQRAEREREEARESLKARLTEAYGPCFLWDKAEQQKKNRSFDNSGLERQLEEKIAEYHAAHAGRVAIF
jgi:hypothetical protein